MPLQTTKATSTEQKLLTYISKTYPRLDIPKLDYPHYHYRLRGVHLDATSYLVFKSTGRHVFSILENLKQAAELLDNKGFLTLQYGPVIVNIIMDKDGSIREFSGRISDYLKYRNNK